MSAAPTGRPGPRVTYDDYLHALALGHPAFAGFAFEGGQPVLLLAAPRPALVGAAVPASLEPEARALVEAVNRAGLVDFGAGLGLSTSRVRLVAYPFADLYQMKRSLLGATRRAQGIASVDIDEARNRLVLGADAPDAVDTAALGLRPFRPGAVEVVHAAPAHLLADVHDRWDDGIAGGLQIQNAVSGRCTLGFNVRWGADLEHTGFVTNSHCTRSYGDGDPESSDGIGQPLYGDLIGREVLDLPFVEDPQCAYPCRYSDSALIAYATARGHDFSYLKRLEAAHFETSRESSIPKAVVGEFYVHNATSFIAQNSPVNVMKTGRRTGWTYGEVVRTCADIDIEHSDGLWRTYRCTNSVAPRDGARPMFVGGGDSGGPVFTRRSGSPDEVTLRGIVFGGSCALPQIYGPTCSQGIVDGLFHYSTIGNVVYDLEVIDPQYRFSVQGPRRAPTYGGSGGPTGPGGPGSGCGGEVPC